MIVIGAGRIGTGLKTAAEARGLDLHLVGRSRGWDALDRPAGEAILVAVRNDDLRELIPRVPAHRRSDLVFVQNGAIRELLVDLGVADPSRGLLYVLAAARDTEPVPGGTTVFTGPCAEASAATLGALGVPSAAVDAAAFAEVELEKLLWLAALGPLCEVHGATVGAVVDGHGAELDALVRELAAVGRATWGVTGDADRLVSGVERYARAIPEYRASVKEWPWRNGWLRDRARAHGVQTPLHDAILVRAGHGG